METKSDKTTFNFSEAIDTVFDKLRDHGIELENLCNDTVNDVRAKVVCVAQDLGEKVNEMGKKPRAETLMVRIDAETSETLDAWVETGYFKSRSEAGALFMREGLSLRASELEKLKDALKDVEHAKENLRDKAREIFGDKEEK